MRTLSELFTHTLKDIYYAENALTKALPKMASAATNPDLKAAFTQHLEETRGQINLLDQIFSTVGEQAAGEKCDAIEGLLKEGEGLMSEASESALDPALIGIAQAVEHYEIARYGTLREWAKELGHTEAHEMLSQILDEEKAANAKLTGLAVKMVNMGSTQAA